jgi:regulatory protein YycI of two-component signal transduction system YycFG
MVYEGRLAVVHVSSSQHQHQLQSVVRQNCFRYKSVVQQQQQCFILVVRHAYTGTYEQQLRQVYTPTWSITTEHRWVYSMTQH